MILATVITPWAGDGTEEQPYCGRILADFNCLTYNDATNAPAETLIPPISILTVDVTLEDAEFAALEAPARPMAHLGKASGASCGPILPMRA